MYFTNTSAPYAISNGMGTSPNMVVANNAVSNFSNSLIANPWPELTLSHNLYVFPAQMNLSTGAPTAGSPLINAGDPDPRYMDLDLTTNDVGCYGGSNSRANFTTPMGGAVVGFMLAPRVVAQGDAVNINATGFDR